VSGAYTVVDSEQVEAVMGAFRKMRIALGLKAFGLNQIEMPPGFAGPEHDESGTSHEEVYVVLSGSGDLHVDGDHVELLPGRYVRVDAGATRQIQAGDAGLTFIAIGAPEKDEFTGRPTL
jgi:mannose-6-phosphate isomerase-like protein (cupin superfamily)